MQQQRHNSQDREPGGEASPPVFDDGVCHGSLPSIERGIAEPRGYRLSPRHAARWPWHPAVAGRKRQSVSASFQIGLVFATICSAIP